MKQKYPDWYKQTLKLALRNKVGFSYVLNLTCSSCAENVCAVETSNERQETLQSEVHSEVRKAYEAPTDVPVVDISVSFDGSWLTRGHTSLIGIACVIDILTCYVIDFEVMCKFSATVLCGVMNLPTPSQRFNKKESGLDTVIETVATVSMRIASKEAKDVSGHSDTTVAIDSGNSGLPKA
ncbi:uncharacterized protein TNCV_3179691 [Trichonephila clavipes]|nr:uncharacterized protein TNCV_3179691 [Trichonephila clavipes]